MNVGNRAYTVRVQLNMPTLILSKLDRYCERNGLKRSDVIKIALVRFLERSNYGA